MSNRTITHEIKLEKSVKIIIGIFAIGVFLNVFAPLLETKSAIAKIGHKDDPLHIKCVYGCWSGTLYPKIHLNTKIKLAIF